MNFQDLHERLRLELLRRVDRGLLTGTGLARQAGFQQGHISNFLTRRRSLSLEGLDRVLAAQGLAVEDLMPLDLSASAAPAPTAGAPSQATAPSSPEVGSTAPPPVDSLPVVSPSAAMDEAVFRPASILETVPVVLARLDAARTHPAPRRASWQRFVALRADGAQAAALDPLVQPGAIVVLDRHYTSPAPYRAAERTLYAVRTGSGSSAALTLRYVEFDAGALLLRPLSPAFPLQVVPLAAHETPADYLIARVCLILNEL